MTTPNVKWRLIGLSLAVVLLVGAPSWALNQDQFEGEWKQFKGELKKQWGKFTDDDLLVIEGRIEKFEGKAQERYGERKEEVMEWAEKWFKEHGDDEQKGS